MLDSDNLVNWKKLNTDITEAVNFKESLNQTIENLSKDKIHLEGDYVKLKLNAEKVQKEWNILSSIINEGQQNLQTLLLFKTSLFITKSFQLLLSILYYKVEYAV